MRKFLSLAVLCGLMFFPVSAHAGIFVLTGRGGERVTLETAPEKNTGKEKGAYYIRLENTDSPWDGKTFLVRRALSNHKEYFEFNYSVELSSGPKEHTYRVLEQTENVLHKGSDVPGYKLYAPDGEEEGLNLMLDQDASAALHKGALADEYKKAPYTPEVE